jgi:thioredoxin-like negative regulator of GroEL
MDNPRDFDAELVAPPVLFPGASAPQSAYRVAHDLLERRAPVEALAVLEPALAEEPRNTGLRSLRAWAFMMRVQHGRAEVELASLVADDPTDVWARHALGRALEAQSRHAEALPHLRLAAAMSDDPIHVAAVRRAEARLADRTD